MSHSLDSKDFGSKIYNRFPPKYQEDDALQNYALKRYLQALSDGGFKHTIDDINGLVGLIDPNSVDASVLPTLFKQYGLELFNGIPEQYLRYLLPRLSDAWSKKGSLDVVEFITSSLSGIKTSTNVVYDANNNPTIDVKFEMDYNLGDYFPESEQFKRLLENFIPFYCDVLIIYSYLFYEAVVLKGKDDNFINMTDEKEDKGIFRLYLPNSAVLGDLVLGKNKLSVVSEVDVLTKDKTTQTINIISEISKDGDDENLVVKLSLVSEDIKVKNKDTILDVLRDTHTDETSFVSGFIPIPNNAVFGSNVMSEVILGVNLRTDYFEDSITSTEKTENAIFNQNIDTFTNRSYNTLNNSFFTNGCYGFDKITIGNNTTIVF